jgi:hypothetical protein
MKIFKALFVIAASVGILTLSPTSVFGLGAILTMDEAGNAYFTPSQPFPHSMGTDPISGMTTLEYSLPFTGVAGDVLLADPSGQASDVLRFDGNSDVYFFSLVEPGQNQLADVGLPRAFITPNVTVTELGTEGVSTYAYYTPTAGQPGYKPAAPGMEYYIISDVPEPSTLLLGALGGGLLLIFNSRRRAKSA